MSVIVLSLFARDQEYCSDWMTGDENTKNVRSIVELTLYDS